MDAGTVNTQYQGEFFFSYVLESDSIIMKIAVVLVMTMIFVVFFRIGILIMGYAFAIETDPIVVKGLKKGTKGVVIRQNPLYKDSVPILRSNNKNDGIEFTWSVWLFIDNLDYLKNQHRHIFHKGNNNIQMSQESERKGVNYPNNAPGLYIKPNSNTLLVIMNTFSNINEEVVVNDIPVQKWINVMIRVEGRNVDVYINGLVVVRRKLNDVPKQNYSDVWVNQNGGFSGQISDLRYFDHAVSIGQVNNIIRKGPNLKTAEKFVSKAFPPYLSIDWFLNNDV